MTNDHSVMSKKGCCQCKLSHVFDLNASREDKVENGQTFFSVICRHCKTRQFIASDRITRFAYKKIQFYQRLQQKI